MLGKGFLMNVVQEHRIGDSFGSMGSFAGGGFPFGFGGGFGMPMGIPVGVPVGGGGGHVHHTGHVNHSGLVGHLGGVGHFGGHGGYSGRDGYCSTTLGVGGLLLLVIFLALIAWAISNGHDRTRDCVDGVTAIATAARSENHALALAIARDGGRNDALIPAILARVDSNAERICEVGNAVERSSCRVIEHGNNWGFQSFRREPCCDDDRRRGRGRDRDWDWGGRGDTQVFDFNTGVQTGLNLGSRGLNNQQWPGIGHPGNGNSAV